MEPAQRLSIPIQPTVNRLFMIRHTWRKGGGRGRLPAQHSAREAEIPHDGSLHVAPIALHEALGDVAEETLVVVQKTAGAGAVGVVVAVGALGIEVQLVDRPVALLHGDGERGGLAGWLLKGEMN